MAAPKHVQDMLPAKAAEPNQNRGEPDHMSGNVNNAHENSKDPPPAQGPPL